MTKPTPYILIASILLLTNPATAEPPLEITGAFGIKLGEVHDPSKMEIKEIPQRYSDIPFRHVQPPKPSVPFTKYEIETTTKSNRIFKISGTSDIIDDKTTATDHFQRISLILINLYDENAKPESNIDNALLFIEQGEKIIGLALMEAEVKDEKTYILMISYTDIGLKKVNEFEKAQEMGINLDSF